MFFKEPTEIRDLGISWADWLIDINGDSLTISSSVWSGPAGITIVDDDIDGSTTIVKVSGGTWGETYELSNTITASNSETETRTLLVRIQRSVSYCTPLEVRRRAAGGMGAGTSATETSLPTAELEALIEQASRMFDRACGVPDGWFNPVVIPVATTKTIYGDGSNYLSLPPYIPGSLSTSLTLPEGYTAPDFIEKDGYLIVHSGSVLSSHVGTYHGSWPYNHPVWQGWHVGVPITVSAIWGYYETPADVKMAVIEMVLNLWRESDPAQVKLVNLEGQPLREKYPPRVIEAARRRRTGVLV